MENKDLWNTYSKRWPVQQALANVLVDVFEPTFSNYSYGFRPKKMSTWYNLLSIGLS